VVDVGADVPAFSEAPELVEGLFDDPPHRLVVVPGCRALISGLIPRCRNWIRFLSWS
jgi:hypothetical protein